MFDKISLEIQPNIGIFYTEYRITKNNIKECQKIKIWYNQHLLS